MRLYFLLILLFFGFTSCTKKVGVSPTVSDITYQPHLPIPHDTIFPLSYLPAYPGSYWKYTGPHNDTTIITTSLTYVKDFIEYANGITGDTVYVPKYDNVFLWGYQGHSHSAPYTSPKFVGYLFDSLPIGSYWGVYYSQGASINRKIVAKDTMIGIGGQMYFPTIVVESYYAAGPPTYVWISREYYTKNIGMIRQDSYSYLDSTISTRVLSNYFINH